MTKKEKLAWQMLELMLDDQAKAWSMYCLASDPRWAIAKAWLESRQ